MKKSFLIIAFIALSLSAYAGRPTGLTPGAGVYWDWTKTSVSQISGNENFFGEFLEVGYTHKFSENASLYSGLRFSNAFTTNAVDVIVKQLASAYFANKIYLDVPVKFNYNFNLSPKVQMFVSAGPTLDFWLKYTESYLTPSFDETKKAETTFIDNFKEIPDSFNRVNVGLGGSVGVFFFNVKVELGYDQYLINPYKIDDVQGSRGQLRISAAYVF